MTPPAPLRHCDRSNRWWRVEDGPFRPHALSGETLKQIGKNRGPEPVLPGAGKPGVEVTDIVPRRGVEEVRWPPREETPIAFASQSGCAGCPSRTGCCSRVTSLLGVPSRPIDCLGARARSLLLHHQLRTCCWRLTPLTQCATCRLVRCNKLRSRVTQTPRRS